MKKLLCSCLALFFIFASFCSPIKVSANESSHAETHGAAHIFIALRDSGKLLADENGFWVVMDNDYVNHPAYDHFLTVIDHCNLAISAGVLEITQTNNINLKEDAALTQDTLMDLRAKYEDSVSAISLPESNMPDNSICGIGNPNPEIYDGGSGSAHSCLAMRMDLIGICEQNYQHIVSHYNSMLVIQLTNPTFDVYSATVLYWVSLVEEEAVWDYKRSTTYGPKTNPLCSYYDGEYHHFTAEYFGNFNYGYTGSFLFSLDILHAGSYAVAGFNAADLEDWPAIDAGYYYKNG